MRTFRSFPIKDFTVTKAQMLNWANQFSISCFLDNHHYHLPLHTYECLLGAGSKLSLLSQPGRAFTDLQDFIAKNPDWMFGHLSYDLKNEIEQLHSSHQDGIGFPDIHFFVPEILCILKSDEISIGSWQDDHEELLSQIKQTKFGNGAGHGWIGIQQRMGRDEYISTIQSLQRHILRGDCYEINLCQELFAEGATIDPLATYVSLAATSPNPFSAYYKWQDRYLICASPERYLKKEGTKLISQPIKGTWPRDLRDAEHDHHNRFQLYHSPKERAENVMVVDLVRHDLSRVCKEGSVKVDELFGVYAFPQVHQMISTISGSLKDNISIPEILHASFPMGSMTGAPKKKVMELIEEYEKTKRGLYSGTLGYISPTGDFDFNVVIRSILYNEENHYLSFQTGSGITFYSHPEKEYEECMLKASAMKKVLQG